MLIIIYFFLKNLKNFEKFSQLKYPSSRTKLGKYQSCQLVRNIHKKCSCYVPPRCSIFNTIILYINILIIIETEIIKK